MGVVVDVVVWFVFFFFLSVLAGSWQGGAAAVGGAGGLGGRSLCLQLSISSLRSQEPWLSLSSRLY